MNPAILKVPHRIGLCLLSALGACLCFPNFLQKTLHPPFAFLAWFTLVPFFLSLQGLTPKKAAGLGYLFGFAHLGGILYWIALLQEAGTLSLPAWLALVGYLSLYFAVFGAAFQWLGKRSGFPSTLLAPLLWVALESFRGSLPWGGFGWGEIGYSQAPYPFFLRITTILGIHGLTFLMVWFNAGTASYLAERWGTRGLPLGSSPLSGRTRALPVVLPAAFIGLVLLAATLGNWGPAPMALGKAALLQPSIDQSEKWSPENEKATYRILGDLSEKASEGKPDLVVWPETAAPAYLLSSRVPLRRVKGIVQKAGRPFLVGCLHQERNRKGEWDQYNAAIPFDGQARAGEFYGKMHLVPFGEFVPFQRYLSFLGPVVGELGTFRPGPAHRSFRAGGFTYTPLICYEAVFPEDVRRASRTGAQVLANISNDAWYGRTASAYQHALMAVAACAQVRKPLIRSANTGICLVTDPFGRILASTRIFERTFLEAEVRTQSMGPTFYERWGDLTVLVAWVLVLALSLRAVGKREV